MSAVIEALEAIKVLEIIASGYMGYDASVGGIVSHGIKLLAEAKELLRNPTKENIREVVERVQICKDNCSPYAAEAPDAMRQINLVLERLQAL